MEGSAALNNNGSPILRRCADSASRFLRFMEIAYAFLSDAMSIEKRYFTSAFSSRS